MKRLMVLFAMLAVFVDTTGAQVMWQVNKQEIVTWNYHSGDEFNEVTPNISYWYTGPPYGRAFLRYDAYYYEQNSKTYDGLLHSICDTGSFYETIEPWLIDSAYLKKYNIKPVNGKYHFDYSIGLLWSKPFYHSGYFEIRFKAPKGKGLWPAFWLYGENSSDEIDFFELKGEQNNKIHVDVHCPQGCDGGYKYGLRSVNWGGWVTIDKYLHDGYNVIAGTWKPGEVTWYLNGVPMAQYPGSFATKMSLIVNIAIAKDKRPFSPGPDKNTPFPSEMKVDYVRVFGKSDTTANPNKVLTYLKDSVEPSVPAKIKAKKYLYSSKEHKNEMGFVSLYKSGFNRYTIELKGKLGKVNYTVYNADGTAAASGTIKNMFNEIDVSTLKRGVYKISIELKDGRRLEESIRV